MRGVVPCARAQVYEAHQHITYKYICIYIPLLSHERDPGLIRFYVHVLRIRITYTYYVYIYVYVFPYLTPDTCPGSRRPPHTFYVYVIRINIWLWRPGPYPRRISCALTYTYIPTRSQLAPRSSSPSASWNRIRIYVYV